MGTWMAPMLLTSLATAFKLPSDFNEEWEIRGIRFGVLQYPSPREVRPGGGGKRPVIAGEGEWILFELAD